jgi:hypothetical protein
MQHLPPFVLKGGVHRQSVHRKLGGLQRLAVKQEPARRDRLLGVDEVGGREDANVDIAAENPPEGGREREPLLDRNGRSQLRQDRDVNVAVGPEAASRGGARP